MDQELSILLADDEAIIVKTIGDYLLDEGHKVDEATDGEVALKMMESKDYDLALVDVRMPKMDGLSLLAEISHLFPEVAVVIITGHGNMETAIDALRLGATDFLLKPIKLLELDAVLERILRVQALRRSKQHLQKTIGGIQALGDFRARRRMFVGCSSSTREICKEIKQVVQSGCDTLLITGDTGTGKEVVAREVHFQGSSDESPFIPVCCPALPDSILESELFGHVKGAFTGAIEKKAGYFELADGGTLFLDEIGDMSSSVQAALLRVLETRTFRPVGGSKEVHVDFRLITATNVSLEKLIESGKFRRDLFYRLNMYVINLLPLRDRREDIIPLAEHFLSLYSESRGIPLQRFSPEAKELLINYDYPGNVRELKNLVERSAILCQKDLIEGKHLGLPQNCGSDTPVPVPNILAHSERSRILEALEGCRWNKREAAKVLGMPYSTLRYKVLKLGLQ